MLSLHDFRILPLQRLPSTVPFLAAYGDDRHGRTTTTCDACQLAVEAPDVWRGYSHFAIHTRLFYVLCMICQAIVTITDDLSDFDVAS